MLSNGHASLLHEALIYSSEEAFLARLVPFLRDGLDADQPTIVILTPKNVALLRDALGQDADQISFADASKHYRRPAYAIAEFRRRLNSELARPSTELVRIV